MIRTEAFSLVLDQFSMLAVSAGAGLLFSGLFCSDTQNVTAFLFQSLEAFAVQFVLGGFAFLVSCSGFGKSTRRLLLWGLTGGGFFLYSSRESWVAGLRYRRIYRVFCSETGEFSG